jgi:hypothetical protein
MPENPGSARLDSRRRFGQESNVHIVPKMPKSQTDCIDLMACGILVADKAESHVYSDPESESLWTCIF